MSSSKPAYLLRSLKKLDEAYKKIQQTQSYTTEAKKIRMLQELLKEQLGDENTRPSTR